MKTAKNRSRVATTRCCEASGAGVATGGCSRNRLASPVTCHSRHFESKAYVAQRTRHTLWVGDERAPRNAAIELRSRFVGVLK
jgi:hypothetical protein